MKIQKTLSIIFIYNTNIAAICTFLPLYKNTILILEQQYINFDLIFSKELFEIVSRVKLCTQIANLKLNGEERLYGIVLYNCYFSGPMLSWRNIAKQNLI